MYFFGGQASLSIIILRFIYVVIAVSDLLLFITEIYNSWFVDLLINSWLPIFAITNEGSVNIL